jgi:hypothetical protein
MTARRRSLPGDGFMALFGAPLTYEDHVRRALLAALAIHGALGENNEADRQRLDLQVRIGIHTGPVVFGPIGHQSPMDYTAIGDTANVAARVQQAAEPGTILLSEATWLHAKDFARVEPVGPLTLKGKDEPILACRLLGVSHRRAGLRESNPAHTTAFVNRESELSILNNFLRQVESGCSQAIGVVGEPGIGKSRLLAEFRWGLADGRITWVEGRCLSYGTAIPYLLVLDLLRSNCEIVETDAPDAITEKVRSGLQEDQHHSPRRRAGRARGEAAPGRSWLRSPLRGTPWPPRVFSMPQPGPQRFCPSVDIRA